MGDYFAIRGIDAIIKEIAKEEQDHNEKKEAIGQQQFCREMKTFSDDSKNEAIILP